MFCAIAQGMKNTIVIIDYGSGNLRSAQKSFQHVCAREGLDYDVKLSNNAEDVLQAERIVLPGQGAFGDCMSGLKAVPGMIEALEEAVLQKGKPFLGICVGMQLLATRGLEHGEHDGLGWIEGEVVPMKPVDSSLKIPHMGWNSLVFPEEKTEPHFVLRSTESSSEGREDYYFVHSFMFESKDKNNILAMTDYGGPVPAVIGKDNYIGVQFHPEKSQEKGLQLITNFMRWRP